MPSLDETDLERELLRKGVGDRAAECPSCVDCGRVPLIGERVYRYASVGAVCELCRQTRRARPESWATVRHVEHGLSVRVRELRRAA